METSKSSSCSRKRARRIERNQLLKDKIFKFGSGAEDTDHWHATFAKRAQPTPGRHWSWCPASFTHRYTSEKRCEDCDQTVEQVQNKLMRPHITRPIGPGIYVIDVGHYKKAPGPPCLKIGMSESSVVNRLEAHLQNAGHERCVVHYCFPVELSNGLSWQIPQILEALLCAHLIVAGAEKNKDNYDYFTWSEALLEQCIEYLNKPGLLARIDRLIANT